MGTGKFLLTKFNNSYTIMVKKVSFSKIVLEPAFLAPSDSFLLPVADLYRFFYATNHHSLANHKQVRAVVELIIQERY